MRRTSSDGRPAKRASRARLVAPAPVAKRKDRAAVEPRRPRIPALLDAETVRFIEADDVAIYVATSDASCRPHVARAYGCRISGYPYSLTTWISRRDGAAALADLANNGRLAFTVSHISTCRTLQLKAADAVIVDIEADDSERVIVHQEGFVRTTASLGYPEAVMRNTIKAPISELAAIRFTPTAVFKQTPGAGAGTALTNAADAFVP